MASTAFESQSRKTASASSQPKTVQAEWRQSSESTPHVAQPEHAEIALLAYGFWLDRNDSSEGSAEEDWFRAEQELRGGKAR